MAAFAAVMAPAITYGNNTSLYTTTSAATGAITTNYRVERWNTATTCNTVTDGWGWDGGTTGAATVEMDYIQFQTLDMPYVQVARGPGYTVRVVRYDNGGVDTTGYWNYNNVAVYAPPKSAADRLREILNSRMAPGVLSNCRPLGLARDIREVRARETLQRVLGEDKFRDFVRRGFISVRAKSGLVYQIFPGHDFTKVYDSGKMVDRLCVVLNGDFPPTDSLIMRYLMILNNEQQFRGYAVKHGAQNPLVIPQQPDQRSLAEIFRELKKVA